MVENESGAVEYRDLAGGHRWWFHGEHAKKPGFLSDATDLDVLNVWRQGVVMVQAAITEMDRRGFPLPVKVGEVVPDASH